jgi:HPt (histidine-containing phosphotransfer) domain-containing protein
VALQKLFEKFESFETLNEIDGEKIQELRKIEAFVGNRQMLAELKSFYLKRAGQAVQDLHTSFLKKDAENFMRQCHTMKSTSSNLGFYRLEKMCEYSESFLAVENSVKPIELEFLFARINQECQRTFELLDTL